MASAINLEATYVTMHHLDSIYYIVALKVYVWCTVVFRVPVAYKLSICAYAPLVSRGWYLSRFYSSNAGLMM